MGLAWKFMLPMALVNILVAALWRFMPGGITRWSVCAALVAASYVMLEQPLARKQFRRRTYRYAD